MSITDGRVDHLREAGLDLRFEQDPIYKYITANNANSSPVYELTFDVNGSDTTINSNTVAPIVIPISWVFTQDDEPLANDYVLKEGMLWYDTNNNNNPYRYDGTAWVDVRDTTLDSTVSIAIDGLADLEAVRDGNIQIFYQTTAPISGMFYGDYWLDTDSDPLTVYRYEDPTGGSTGVLSWL